MATSLIPGLMQLEEEHLDCGQFLDEGYQAATVVFQDDVLCFTI